MEAPAAQKIKVGPVTLALGLIALGGGLLGSNLGYTGVTAVLKFWPLLLIGLGVEYFIRRLTGKEKEIHFSIPSSFLIGLIIIFSVAASALYSIIPGNLFDLGLLGNNASYIRQWQGDPVTISPGSSLEVSNKMGDIDITASPDDKLHLSASIEGRESSGDRARAAAEAVVIHVKTGPVTKVYTTQADGFGKKGVAVKFQLAIPPGLNIDTGNNLGNITARGLSAENIMLQSSAGRVVVEDCTGNIGAENKLGEIEISGVKGDIKAQAAMGRITIKNPRGDVTATTRNGSINLESDNPLNGNYVLRGDNGEITLRLPRSSDLMIKASTKNGGISGLENIKGQPGSQSGETSLGSGKGSADLETRNGRIDVLIKG